MGDFEIPVLLIVDGLLLAVYARLNGATRENLLLVSTGNSHVELPQDLIESLGLPVLAIMTAGPGSDDEFVYRLASLSVGDVTVPQISIYVLRSYRSHGIGDLSRYGVDGVLGMNWFRPYFRRITLDMATPAVELEIDPTYDAQFR
jgi:hypothetical protein